MLFGNEKADSKKESASFTWIYHMKPEKLVYCCLLSVSIHIKTLMRYEPFQQTNRAM